MVKSKDPSENASCVGLVGARKGFRGERVLELCLFPVVSAQAVSSASVVDGISSSRSPTKGIGNACGMQGSGEQIAALMGRKEL